MLSFCLHSSLFLSRNKCLIDFNLFCYSWFTGDCNFETGMCTYDNTQAEDQFDWLRNAGGTPSWKTGPSVDHTLGTTLGKVCYFVWALCS